MFYQYFFRCRTHVYQGETYILPPSGKSWKLGDGDIYSIEYPKDVAKGNFCYSILCLQSVVQKTLLGFFNAI